MDNSCGLCFLLWPIGNPSSPARHIGQTVPHVIGHLKSLARQFGYHTMLAMTHRESLARKFTRLGFRPDDQQIRLHSIHV